MKGLQKRLLNPAVLGAVKVPSKAEASRQVLL